MANRMEEVAKLFGLELGEHFHITKESSKDVTYKFTEEGVLFYSNEARVWYESVGALAGILTGDTEVIKLPWKPAKGEKYYIPYVSALQARRYEEYHWAGDKTDEEYYKQGIIFRTKEEALAMTEKILAFVREERNND